MACELAACGPCYERGLKVALPSNYEAQTGSNGIGEHWFVIASELVP
jgi:hypothetical protein